MAVDAAALLLHEMTHAAGLGFQDTPGTCAQTILFENTFKWAMLRRYPVAMETPCCQEVYGADGQPMAVAPGLFLHEYYSVASCPDDSTVPGGRSTDTRRDPPDPREPAPLPR
jgi:hypothetical protein